MNRLLPVPVLACASQPAGASGITGNKAAGSNVGFTVQFHVFLEDLMPNTIGKPIFQ